jgi:metal-responsive CopG/Arc/MetJ family transcriptional regulator
MSQKKEKVRVQFDFQLDALEHLDELVAATGAASRAEVVRRALSLYDAVLVAQQEGKEVVLKKGKGEEQKLLIL